MGRAVWYVNTHNGFYPSMYRLDTCRMALISLSGFYLGFKLGRGVEAIIDNIY